MERARSLQRNQKIVWYQKRAESLANAFGIHPSIIKLPEYEDPVCLFII
jgi:hypothetical protein